MSTRSARAERRAAKRRTMRILITVIIILVIAAVAFIAYTNFFSKKAPSFNSSLDRNQPFEFVLGQAKVIPGWNQELVGWPQAFSASPIFSYNT